MKKWLLRGGGLLLGIIICSFAYYQLWFLRQPARTIPDAPSSFVSPANGMVAAVTPWTGDTLQWEKDDGQVRVLTEDLGTEGYLIAIEMDVTNVHYQRAPMNGRVISTNYTEGQFNNALIQTNKYGFRIENERNSILLESTSGLRYKVVQIAGLLARRIVDYVEPGQNLKQGEVIGLIKLGSQVALIVPKGVEPLVEVGDEVVDGETIVARVR
jgi:phosphatidylserine decarboxylase